MSYILMVWTVVAMAGDRHVQQKAYGWQPTGEFQSSPVSNGLELCEAVGRQLGLKTENFRCVRSR